MQLKAGANILFVDENVFPQTLAVIRTRSFVQGIELQVGDYNAVKFTDKYFGAIIQYPNSNGSIEDYTDFVADAHAHNCIVAVAADILSLALLTHPGR